MTESIRMFAPDASTSDVTAEIRRNGVAVVENLFTAKQMDTLV